MDYTKCPTYSLCNNVRYGSHHEQVDARSLVAHVPVINAAQFFCLLAIDVDFDV